MDEVKKIISRFIRVSPSEIGSQTAIGKTNLKSSILIHRMYAEMAAAGFKVSNYASIHTYGDLVNRISGEGSHVAALPVEAPFVQGTGVVVGGLGIDIESVSQLPEATDYRSHEFYVNNFTAREISYCVLMQDPRQSFAGLFSAKEAVKKASALFRDFPLNKIEIEHSDSGLPVFSGFQISISHSDGLAVAVAFSGGNWSTNNNLELVQANAPVVQKSSRLVLIVSLLALAISLITFFMVKSAI